MNNKEAMQFIKDNKHLLEKLSPELQKMLEDMISPPSEEDSVVMREEISNRLTGFGIPAGVVSMAYDLGKQAHTKAMETLQSHVNLSDDLAVKLLTKFFFFASIPGQDIARAYLDLLLPLLASERRLVIPENENG